MPTKLMVLCFAGFSLQSGAEAWFLYQSYFLNKSLALPLLALYLQIKKNFKSSNHD